MHKEAPAKKYLFNKTRDLIYQSGIAGKTDGGTFFFKEINDNA